MARTVPHRVAEEPDLEKSLAEKLVVLAVVVIPFLGTIAAIVMLWNQWVNWVDL
ncbi:MAG: acyl-CoA desaturase, partial [Chloroflexia bacterium]|nr:acyl-CoA desaturase [Chloroflexia bacterium]